ncbi:hypothetical protein Hanom_Chr17g01569061 [Helianthus anomalus]
MDGVNEPEKNGKISNLWAKVAKLAKPKERKWHFYAKVNYELCCSRLYVFKRGVCQLQEDLK